MLKIYCSDCGAPTNYTSIKPKFCTGCGNPFDKTLVNKVLNQKTTVAQQNIITKKILPKLNEDELYEIENDDFSEVNHVPEINQLDCEIIESYKKGEKIKNLLGTSSGSSRQNQSKNQKKISKTERKKFLEDFAREAGAIKPKTRINKNAT